MQRRNQEPSPEVGEPDLEIRRTGTQWHVDDLLGKNRSGIECGVHLVNGGAGAPLSPAQRPEDGVRSTTHRQQRGMHIDPTEGRHREQRRGKTPGETGGDDGIRAVSSDSGKHVWVLEGRDLQDRDAGGLGKGHQARGFRLTNDPHAPFTPALPTC